MKGRIDALTSLRFFAAAAIFSLHSVQFPGFPVASFGGFVLNHGVSFFYVLSGFILHYNYRHKEISWAQFMGLRFARIWPLHLFGLGLALVLHWSDITSWIHAYVSPAWTLGIVLMLQAWAPDHKIFFAINGVSWSISVEMFFYACFIPLSLAFRKRPILVLTGAVAFHALYLFVTWTYQQPTDLAGPYSINPAFRLLEFVIGIVAAELLSRSGRRRFGTVAEIAVVLLVLWADSKTMVVTDFAASFAMPPVSATVYTMWVDPFFAILFCVFAAGKGAVSKLMSWRPLIILGELSFALYLVHQPIQWAVSKHLQSLGPAGMLAASIFAALAVSAAGHYWIEKPFYKVASRLFTDRQIDRSSTATAA